jgi:hypothetical protein
MQERVDIWNSFPVHKSWNKGGFANIVGFDAWVLAHLE